MLPSPLPRHDRSDGASSQASSSVPSTTTVRHSPINHVLSLVTSLEPESVWVLPEICTPTLLYSSFDCETGCRLCI